jgi:carbonic anhydrase/acetyltransferase-like protein (isoleucine patch superfamily)
MPIYALGDQVPVIHPDAFVHPDAVIIGSVTIGAQSSVWAGAVMRGDDGYIEVGERSSIQDGTVVHTTPFTPTVVGNDCVVGHVAHLEGCRLEDFSQVSSGAVVLHNAVIGRGAIVAANSVVLNNTVVPAGALAVGAPAAIKEGRARLADIEMAVNAYVAKTARFKKELRRID